MTARPNFGMAEHVTQQMAERMAQHMAEATRLTRAGRLADAMALLQGGAAGPASPRPEGSDGRRPGGRAVIDMVPPAGAGAAWTAPDAPAAPEGIQAMLDRLGTLASPGIRRTPSRAAPLPAGARFETRSLAHATGQRSYKLYVPSGLDGGEVPLVVMLHGCTQSPDDFAAGTRMNELAEEQRFLVAYPEQTQTANASKCWNWFNPADQGRDGGEPSLIADVTRQILREESVDPARVYVAGLSAGGAAAAIMGETYPDLYAAIGVHSGLACGAARDMPSAFKAMRQGGAPKPRKQARSQEHRRVPAIVFHGDGDRTVNPVNGDQVVAQLSAGAGLLLSQNRGEAGGMAFTRTVQRDQADRAVLEQWVLHGAGHAWSGGSSAGSFTDPRGPDASREMLRFFWQHTKADPQRTKAGAD